MNRPTPSEFPYLFVGKPTRGDGVNFSPARFVDMAPLVFDGWAGPGLVLFATRSAAYKFQDERRLEGYGLIELDDVPNVLAISFKLMGCRAAYCLALQGEGFAPAVVFHLQEPDVSVADGQHRRKGR